MARIEWDDSFSVGNSEIDDQHKRWIDLYNKMDEALTGGGVASIDSLAGEALAAMNDYAHNHFKFEEAYMAKLNYPKLVEHRRIHRDFEDMIYRYNREINDGQLFLNSSLIKIIRNWLLDHILHEDKKYSAFAQGS
ncbi:MAG: hypothetical protein C0613_03675 [Desulfobulbaceae bacterium]|nr:MAG: hypothetical protein C0613_03675 [Desulfobulbaceae bacterium]